MNISLTGWVGVVSTLLGTLAVILLAFSKQAAHENRGMSARSLLFCAMFLLYYCVDILTDLRFGLKTFVTDILRENDMYASRMPFQLIALFASFSCLFFLVYHAIREVISQPLELVIVCCVFGFGSLWLLEMVSLHDIDAVLYADCGGVLVIGWLWGIFGLLIVALTFFRLRMLPRKQI